jgi:hypothetical protein
VRNPVDGRCSPAGCVTTRSRGLRAPLGHRRFSGGNDDKTSARRLRSTGNRGVHGSRLCADRQRAPSGPHYNLNIIGVEKGKRAPLTGSERHTIFVALNSRGDVSSKIYLVPGDDFRVCDGNAFDPAIIESGRIYEVRVKVPRGVPAGRYMEGLQVETDHPRRRQLRIGVNVFVKNDLYASPEFVAFDEVNIDQLRRPMAAKLLGQSVIVSKAARHFRTS